MAKFCGECGSPFYEAQRFCSNCGTPRGSTDNAALRASEAAPRSPPEPPEEVRAAELQTSQSDQPVAQSSVSFEKAVPATAAEVSLSEAAPEVAEPPAGMASAEGEDFPSGEDQTDQPGPAMEVACGHCAEPLEADSLFCPSCGTAAGSAEPPAGTTNGEPVRLHSPLSLAIGATMLGAFLFGAWNTYGPDLTHSWQAEEVAAAAPEPVPEMSAPAAIPDLPVASEVPVVEAAIEEPALNGIFRATIADQTITLTFNGGYDRAIRKSQGVAHYANAVTGKECTNMFTAIESSWNGSSVVLKQSSVAGLPACDGKIDMRLTPDVNGQQAARTISVQWLNPQGGADLMSGTLTRDPE